jgi:hypothetical protein
LIPKSVATVSAIERRTTRKDADREGASGSRQLCAYRHIGWNNLTVS